MFDPATRQLIDPGRSNKQYNFDYNLLLSDVQQAARRNQFIGNTLLDNLVLSTARGGGFAQFYDLHIIDSDLDEFGPHPRAEFLALAMLRQNPSFARIRRVWETTRAFWQETLPTETEASPQLPDRPDYEGSQPTGNHPGGAGQTQPGAVPHL